MCRDDSSAGETSRRDFLLHSLTSLATLGVASNSEVDAAVDVSADNKFGLGGKVSQINGKEISDVCRGSRGQNCQVWVPPEVEKSSVQVGERGEITNKVYLDVRIIRDYSREVLEDGVLRGRIVFGLYGKQSPQTVQHFLKFVTANYGEGPAYSSGMFYRHEAGRWIEGGRINGLSTTQVAGQETFQWNGRVVPLAPILETNSLRHDRKFLLSHRKFNPGPEFDITLSSTPELDASNTVFGEVIAGEEYVQEIVKLPFVTGKSLDPEGSPADSWWKAQREFFRNVAKVSGDTRVTNTFPGKLLRRVEITKCGLI